ncbi:HAMP domain-containing histidine kinase [Oscillibacter valericigenes]|uniref:sensor histidine kinase n=1 Tax=Oscillibacter valericigenes TaxID=351091 RepID=UPI001F2592C9|nr:HAMP domain-containing sensor histidine kinase [Oscillibacter valericigenes]MCF2617825.1 HAMP domain-containing histidine kinase [Oscillibacter valericigenes]
MIRKLRLKFVAICMALVTAILAVVFFSVYLSMARNISDLSRQVLYRVSQEEMIGGMTRPDISIAIGGDRVLLPYFTVNVWPSRGGGYTAQITGGTYSNLEDTEELTAILQDCLSQNRQEGTVSGYHLRYLRQDNGLYEKLAFVDMSMEQAVLRRMMGSYLVIALAALALLLGVSVLLSHWATRPVEKAWKQQRQFLSDASHELKTPLTVILSNAELLEQTELPDKPARWTDNILSEAGRMRSLVEEMLTLARADNMVRTAVMAEVSLSDVAADCALAFEPVAFEAGKPLEYQIADGTLVLGDGDKLRQLISILLDNAIKYGADGGTITLSLQKTDRQARLTVSNPGDPIPPEQLGRLFERFYRADVSRGEKSGFGLGLPIARTIAEEHKGTLRAESDAGSTRFIYTMMLKK